MVVVAVQGAPICCTFVFIVALVVVFVATVVVVMEVGVSWAVHWQSIGGCRGGYVWFTSKFGVV